MQVPNNAELEQSTLAILGKVNVIDFSLKQLLQQLGGPCLSAISACMGAVR